MTVAIMHDPARPMLPYASWLADGAAGLALITGPPASLPPCERDRYDAISYCGDFAGSAEAEDRVLELAARRPLSALVAVSPADAIRAGALRDYLGLPGQSRGNAIIWRDLAEMRRQLAACGVPAVPAAPIEQVCHLYQCAHEWGYPIRLRKRRSHGWPLLRVLHSEAELTEYAAAGLVARFGLTPAITAEPHVAGASGRVLSAVSGGGRVFRSTGDSGHPGHDQPRATPPGPPAAPSAGADPEQLARKVAAALTVPEGYPVEVTLTDVQGSGLLAGHAVCGATGPAAADRFRRLLGVDPSQAMACAQAGAGHRQRAG